MLVLAMFAENTGLKEILSSMQKDVGYIMEWFDTHREMYRSSGTSTEEVEPDEELSKVLDKISFRPVFSANMAMTRCDTPNVLCLS